MTKMSSDFRQIILDFPQQFREILKMSQDFNLEKKYKQILVFGMGGSAWPTEILDGWLNQQNKDYLLNVVRDYHLPPNIPADTLLVFSSYSGNTEEPLTAYQEAKKAELPMIAITSGGKLSELCLKDNVRLIKIPAQLEPRLATGYLFGALAKITATAINDDTHFYTLLAETNSADFGVIQMHGITFTVLSGWIEIAPH